MNLKNVKFVSRIFTFIKSHRFTILLFSTCLVCLFFVAINVTASTKSIETYRSFDVLPQASNIRPKLCVLEVERKNNSEEIRLSSHFPFSEQESTVIVRIDVSDQLVGPVDSAFSNSYIDYTYDFSTESENIEDYEFIDRDGGLKSGYYKIEPNSKSDTYINLDFNDKILNTSELENRVKLFLPDPNCSETQVYISGLEGISISEVFPEPKYRFPNLLIFEFGPDRSKYENDTVQFTSTNRELVFMQERRLFFSGFIGGILCSILASILYDAVKELDSRVNI